jgi:regulatory protein
MRQRSGHDRVLKPLTPSALNDMALRYVARFATSAAKLEHYLVRKIRERGWDGEDHAPVSALVERFVAAGYVDDEVYARSKSGSLLRRGYGKRRIDQALGAAGIADEVREAVAAGEDELRRAALALARKRRFGPFGKGPDDRASREKQLGAMLRAGHRLDMARELVNSVSIEAAEEWAAGDG